MEYMFNWMQLIASFHGASSMFLFSAAVISASFLNRITLNFMP